MTTFVLHNINNCNRQPTAMRRLLLISVITLIAIAARGQIISPSFDLRGNSSDYTMVELFVGAKGNVPLARMLVKNGQTLHCKLDIENPSENEIKGNKPSEQWCRFVRDNAAVLYAEPLHFTSNAKLGVIAARHSQNSQSKNV